MWTRFMDMHSGGGSKESYEYIYIEAPEEEAKIIFYNRFGHNPERVSCTCCGDDYSISSEEDLTQVTGYDRNCRIPDPKKYTSGRKKGLYKNDDPNIRYYEAHEECPTGYSWSTWTGYDKGYKTLAAYRRDKSVLFIPKNKIKASERIGELSEQGYIWKD